MNEQTRGCFIIPKTESKGNVEKSTKYKLKLSGLIVSLRLRTIAFKF